jgi:hypothetical protein
MYCGITYTEAREQNPSTRSDKCIKGTQTFKQATILDTKCCGDVWVQPPKLYEIYSPKKKKTKKLA